jgi:sugar-specific transcriptional regulator TrmB
MIQDEHIQTLIDFGLSLLQARTYLNLVELGKANVQTIARASSVARQDVYRIMPTLQELGLAEKILTKPTMYRATPLKNGLSILLQKRKKEYAELREKTSSLLNTFHENKAKTALQEEDSQFTIISEKTLIFKKLEKLTQTAQASIDITVPLNLVEGTLFCFLQCFKSATRRGVKIRMITQKAAGESTPRMPQALAKNPFFELKYLPNFEPRGMNIFDRKEVTLCVCEKDGLPAFWSNSQHVLKLATSYFDDLWNRTHENLNSEQKQKSSTRF